MPTHPVTLAGGAAHGSLPCQTGRANCGTQPLPCPHYPHTVIVAIGDIDIALRVHVTAMRPVQSSRDGWPVVAGPTPTSPSDRRDDPSHRVNMTNGMVLGIHDQQVAVVVTPDGLGGSPGSG